MKKVVDNFNSNILKQIKKEVDKIQKGFVFLKTIKKINYKENSIIFESALQFLCDPTKTVDAIINSELDIIFKEGKFIYKDSKEKVENLFGRDIFLKNNILSLANPNIIINIDSIKSIAGNIPTFEKFLDFINRYSIIINNYKIIEEQYNWIDDYVYALKHASLNSNTFMDKVDKVELKKMINKHNKDYTKFVKEFNTFGLPYKLLINL